jgi:hypothetical protein
MIQQRQPYAWSLRFFLFCGGLLLVATIYTAYAQLYLLPPRLAADVGQMSPILLQSHQWLWEHARDLGRWGVREGILDPKIREFGKNGIPAYFISLIGGLVAALMAVSTGLIALLGRSGVQAAEASVTPPQLQLPENPPARQPSSASPTSFHWATDKAEHHGQTQTAQGNARDWRFGCTEPPIQQRRTASQERKIVFRGEGQGSLPSTLQKTLDESHHCISEAQGVLQRLQRSTLNLALTHPLLEAGDDVTEVHLAMASLDRLLRTIKSSQAEISEQLAHLDADHPPSRGPGTS